MLRLMVTLVANSDFAEGSEWSCLEYERNAQSNPQCQRAFKAVEDCRIDDDNRLMCAPAKSIDNLERCENGRRELIDLRCLPKDCSCDIDVIDATNSTQIAKCIDFRNQFVTNPCFATIENLQKEYKFSIPYDSRYSYENRNSFIPRKYPSPNLQPKKSTAPTVDQHKLASILLVVIGLAILIVLALIGFLWRSSKKERFEKELVPSDADLENIVQAELDKYALGHKEKTPFIEKC